MTAARHRFGLLYPADGTVVEGIEAVAAARYLPRVDVILDPRQPVGVDGPTRVIFAGRLAGESAGASLLGHPDLVPLLASVGLAAGRGDDADPATLESPTLPPHLLDALAAHGPVGARDLATLVRLESLGIPAYFSGCLTLALPEVSRQRSGGVLLVDVPPALADRVPGPAGSPTTSVRTDDPTASRRATLGGGAGGLGRYGAARALLRQCASARLVVTTDRTVAQAATALGTPSILLTGPAGSERDHADLAGVVHLQPLDAAVDDPGVVDWSVDTVPGGHRVIASHLDRTCREFVAGTIPGGARELVRDAAH